MAKTKLIYYRCIFVCDVGYWAPDQRKERWVRKGGVLVQPQRTLHSIRMYPSYDDDPRWGKAAADHIAVPKPLARQYTEEVTKKVSRPRFTVTGRRAGRIMRPKTSKIKFVRLDPDEVTERIRQTAYFFDDWHESLFIDATEDVHLPKENAVEPPPEDDENPKK